ncbi:ribosomal-processing cysteine protease Prp [Radiobacillus sp. PE A8.2]|uniref:ribosomal-processing cysteine protease Prp n=1 Tax=Radiobacillus sp. PE A8.2 TaxID=3380349 RepID=UPI00388DBC6B
MIKVTIYRKDDTIYAFELSGHAESVSEGEDLVCAGVSAVTFGTVNAIEKLCEFEPSVEMAGKEGGYLRMELPEHLTDTILEKTQLLLEGMLVSLETINLDYGQYMTISNK